MSARDDVISPAETACSASSRSGSISTTTDSPYFMMTGTDLQYDQHSSEEELEVINNTPKETFRKYKGGVQSGAASAAAQSAAPPEKRKWSATQCGTGEEGVGAEPDPDRLASPFTANLSVAENDENAAGAYNAVCSVTAMTAAASSDEEALRSPDALPAPVRFRTSPPLEALKPRRAEARLRGLPPLAALGARACSCCAPQPPNTPNNHHLLPYDVSPRKRSRHSRRHMQRPCLDFDKMQQLKVRAVTAWRHGGAEHGGELSVFCW
ncbi:uncharacterized protein LOC143912212 isoform X2 [Arctopsyche grandis]